MSTEKTFTVEVIIKSSSPESLPDYGIGKGVLASMEISFSDPLNLGFDSPNFYIAKLEWEEKLMRDYIEIRWTLKEEDK